MLYFNNPIQNSNEPVIAGSIAVPCDGNAIGKYFKEISKNAGLSYMCINSFTWGTTATVIEKAGYSLQDIVFVLQH